MTKLYYNTYFFMISTNISVNFIVRYNILVLCVFLIHLTTASCYRQPSREILLGGYRYILAAQALQDIHALKVWV